jgi:hypothetical protein
LLVSNREEGRKALRSYASTVVGAKAPLTNRETAKAPGETKQFTAAGAKAAFAAQIKQD